MSAEIEVSRRRLESIEAELEGAVTTLRMRLARFLVDEDVKNAVQIVSNARSGLAEILMAEDVYR